MAKNKRCPLQVECEKKCTFEGHELNCDYYKLNAREGYEIEDQEVLRREQARKLQEKLDEERYEQADDSCFCRGCPQACICAGGCDSEGREACDGLQNCMQTGCTHQMRYEMVQPSGVSENVTAPSALRDEPNAQSDGRAQIVYLPVKSIYPHPQNPRKDLGDLSELVGSIKEKGILQNLTVVPRVIADVTITDEWVAVIGHRRHAAAIQAGLTEVPCVISNMTPKEQFETMMIENVQRNALTAYEQAKGFQMMLDMGDSVEEVAKKTGFSESTIRRRAQLAQLDEDKFKKTEKRGASLEDYLKLSKIQDPSKRNKVLESIGTREFANELKKAVEQEKYQKFFAQLKEALKKADWVEQVDRVDCDHYQWKATYNSGNQQIPSPVEGSEPGEYVYIINGDSISLYHRKGKKPKKSEEDKLLSRLQKEIEEINQELGQIRKRFFEIRFEFVKGFTAFSTYEMDIAAFAANAIVENQNGRAEAELVAKLLGISTYRPSGQYYDCIKKEEWESVLFRRPQEALLYAAYAKLDGKNQGYYETKYEYKLSLSMPIRSKNERLNLLYKGLVSLGYEMSEEEVQLQNGTHPLFDRAKAFKKTYDQELAKLKKNRK